MESVNYIPRTLEEPLHKALARGKSLFLFGARQTGKTTLVGRLPCAMRVTLSQPDVRLRYERSPGLLRGEVEALTPGEKETPVVVLDEVQKVPVLLDEVQDLVDRGRARFILTGSSARKLRRGSSANLLPGRALVFHLDPLSLRERMPARLDDALTEGSLPGIVVVEDAADREADLAAYVTTYLEEEVRAEALVRSLGSFARFLELAAAEAGSIMNLRGLSGDVGVAHTTIAAYYQILEDCLIAERIEPLTTSTTRKKLTRSDRYLFFDMGVRRVAAREGRRLLPSRWGQLFEQWVGLELLRWSRTTARSTRIRFWRDPDGPEVDWIVDQEGRYTPIEVKWTEIPNASDTRHLRVFMDEYRTARVGYVVCRTPRRVDLGKGIVAIPWQDLAGTIEEDIEGS
jgi:predicted AAA+ superfamily ATPase